MKNYKEKSLTEITKLKWRLVAVLIAVAIVLIGAMTLAVLAEAARKEKLAIKESLLQMAQLHIVTIRDSFERYANIAKVLTEIMGSHYAIEPSQRRSFFDSAIHTLLISHPQIINIFTVWKPDTIDYFSKQYANQPFSDESGNYISLFTRASGVVRQRPYANWEFALSQQPDELVVQRPLPFTALGRQTEIITVSQPIFSSQTHEKIGLVGVSFDGEFLLRLIASIRPYQTGTAALFAHDGQLIARSTGDEQEPLPHLDSAPEAVAISDHQNFTVFYPFHFDNGKQNWCLVLSVPAAVILRNAMHYTYYVLIVGCAITVIFSFFVWRRITVTFALLEYSEQMRCEAEATGERVKNEFFTRMSHEIRTPLNSIFGLTELMRTDNLDALQQNYLSDIRRMTGWLLVLINDVLDFAKIEVGKIMIVPVSYDMHALFTKLVNIYRAQAEQKGLAFNSRRAENVPAILHGDEMRIRQIIASILNNAIKYTATGSVDFLMTTTTRADDRKNYLVAQVKDTGRGICEADLSRLFGAFTQFNSMQNSGISGTGLGLALSKKILDLIGGKIDVSSVPDQGTTFTVYFPLEIGNLENVADNSVCDLWALSNGLARVLVVDDTDVNLTVAVGFLAEHNITADTAESGETALQKVTKKDYDLILLDHMMPGIDGCETARRLRALGGRWSKLPIVAFSANATQAAQNMFRENGMDDFMAKPIDSEILNTILTRYLPIEKIILTETRTTADAARDENLNLRLTLHALADIDIEQGVYNADGDWTRYRANLGNFCQSENFMTPTTGEIARQLTLIGATGLAEKIRGLPENAPFSTVTPATTAIYSLIDELRKNLCAVLIDNPAEQ